MTDSRGSDRVYPIAGAIVLVVLLCAFALVIRRSQSDASQALKDRFAIRASLTASFVRDYVDDVANRERSQAQRLLSDPTVDETTFDRVVQAGDFQAAVLLDGDGRLLQVYPGRPDIVGTDMTVAYPHLRAAVAGTVGVSNVVPSAARQVPVTAVAVPFATPTGRRVFSGAIAPTSSPLGAHLASVTNLAGSDAFVLDASGETITAAREDQVLYAAVRGLPAGVHDVDVDGAEATVVVMPVADTPWRVVMSAPTAALTAPVTSEQWAAWALWCAFAVAGLLVLLLFRRLVRARRLATEISRLDVLTGLPNRRAMEQQLTAFTARAARSGEPLAALMLDLDHFKTINDLLGHETGDRVLHAAGTGIAQSLRGGDAAGRWGGEEFLALLPGADLDGAVAVAERVRTAVSALVAAHPELPVTISVGVAMFTGDSDEMLRDADHALYGAKQDGRDRVATILQIDTSPRLTVTASTT